MSAEASQLQQITSTLGDTAERGASISLQSPPKTYFWKPASRCLGTQALREATPKPTAHTGEGPSLRNPPRLRGFLFQPGLEQLQIESLTDGLFSSQPTAIHLNYHSDSFKF